LQYLLDWVIGFDDDVVVLEVWAQAASCVYQGQGQLFHHLISGFRILQRSADKVNKMLRAAYILDKRSTDGVVGGCDINQQGLMSIQLVKDRW